MDRLPKMVKLIISIAIPLAGGLLSGFLSMQNIKGFYLGLVKPSFAPPAWVFGPVWTILYILMGIAVFLIWEKGLNKEGVIPALGVFIFQLALNFSWTPVFFGLKSLAGGFVIIIVLWIAILVTMVLFWRLNKVAGLLLIPYLLWVTIATALNYSVMRLN